MNEEFNKKLNEFAEKQAQLFLNKVSEEINIKAKELCPVKTGALKESIHWYNFKKLYNKIGSNKHYAGYVELGTRFMAPRNFLRGAARIILGRYR